jgi:hypothetical protein
VELAPDVDRPTACSTSSSSRVSARAATKFLAKTKPVGALPSVYGRSRNEIQVKLPSGLVAHIDGKTSELPSSVDVNLHSAACGPLPGRLLALTLTRSLSAAHVLGSFPAAPARRNPCSWRSRPRRTW